MKHAHDDARPSNSAGDSASAREALLMHLPVGSGLSTVLAALSDEGFGCRILSPPAALTNVSQGEMQKRAEEVRNEFGATKDMQPHGAHLDCQLLAGAQLGYTHWIIDLQFDGVGHLNHTNV